MDVQRALEGIFLNAYKKWGHLSENRMAFMMLLVLASALCTERLGIHLLFGAFLMGAIMPKEPVFVRYVLDRFETITVTCCCRCSSPSPACAPISGW